MAYYGIPEQSPYFKYDQGLINFDQLVQEIARMPARDAAAAAEQEVREAEDRARVEASLFSRSYVLGGDPGLQLAPRKGLDWRAPAALLIAFLLLE